MSGDFFVPGYTATEECGKQRSKMVIAINGYRSDDPARRAVVMKVFTGGIEACILAGEIWRFFNIELVRLASFLPRLPACRPDSGLQA